MTTRSGQTLYRILTLALFYSALRAYPIGMFSKISAPSTWYINIISPRYVTSSSSFIYSNRYAMFAAYTGLLQLIGIGVGGMISMYLGKV